MPAQGRLEFSQVQVQVQVQVTARWVGSTRQQGFGYDSQGVSLWGGEGEETN